MTRQLPPNLVSFFTRALKTFQLSEASFSVLCTLPGPSAAPSEPAPRPPAAPPRTLIVLDSSFNPPTLAHQRMALSALEDDAAGSGSPHAGSGSGSAGSDAGPGPEPSRVLLLLAINNADKAPKPAAFPQRLAMMYVFALDLLASASSSHAVAAPAAAGAVDIAVTTEPYFHSKAQAVGSSDFYSSSSSPDAAPSWRPSDPSPTTQVYLTGYDTLIRIFDPKYYDGAAGLRAALDPFFSRARLRVTARTDADWGDAAAQRAYLEGLRAGRLEEVGGRAEWAARVALVEGRRDGEEVISSTRVRAAVAADDWDGLRRLVSDDVAAWVRTEGLYREV